MINASKKLKDRLKSLHRKRAHLAQRIANFKGKSPSFDIAEHSAIDFSIRFIEENRELALQFIREEVRLDDGTTVSIFEYVQWHRRV